MPPPQQRERVERSTGIDPADCVRASLAEPLPLGWVQQPAPPVPLGWGHDQFTLPTHRRRLLQLRNPHPRDVRISFDEGPHTYWVDGIAVGWSVTGLVKYLCNEFDPDGAIAMMRSGGNWPRAGYVTLSQTKRTKIAVELADVMRAAGNAACAARVMAAVGVSPPAAVECGGAPRHDELAVSLQALRPLCVTAPEPMARGIKRAVDMLADGDDEIVLKWEQNKTEAANLGTWMQLQCELWLNRDGACMESIEMKLFLRYVRERLAPKRVAAFRTEWEVFGETVDLAGSVDFVGIVTEGPDAGGLWIVDWKRTKQLRYKGDHPLGYRLLPPLSHVPDASKWHYALQLNLYSYLLETFYDKRVVHREVACFHPDNGDAPYYYEVPCMPEITNYFIALQQKLAADRVVCRATAKLGCGYVKCAREAALGL